MLNDGGVRRIQHLTFNIQHSTFLFLLVFACSNPHPVHPIHRVVTLSPNLTEIVFAIGAGSDVVATDDYSDDPPAAKRLPKVGGVQPSLERIVAAKPDLVLAPAIADYTSLSAALKSNHIPIEIIRTDRIADITPVMQRLGKELGAPHTDDAVRFIRHGLARQTRKRALSPRILFVARADPLYVGGRETFIDDLYAITGAQNAVQVKAWPQYAVESVVASPPDIVLYTNHIDIAPLLRAAPELRDRAMIVAIDETRYARPGPHVVDAAADLNGIIDRWENRPSPAASRHPLPALRGEGSQRGPSPREAGRRWPKAG
jgi:ABC-type hemin transport system substrate-binding protein